MASTMTDATDEQGHAGAPTVPGSAVWLKGELLEITSALYPDRRPMVVREWTDPVRLRDPAPVGHRFLFLLCADGDDRPTSPGFDDALNAFSAAKLDRTATALGPPRGEGCDSTPRRVRGEGLRGQRAGNRDVHRLDTGRVHRAASAPAALHSEHGPWGVVR